MPKAPRLLDVLKDPCLDPLAFAVNQASHGQGAYVNEGFALPGGLIGGC